MKIPNFKLLPFIVLEIEQCKVLKNKQKPMNKHFLNSSRICPNCTRKLGGVSFCSILKTIFYKCTRQALMKIVKASNKTASLFTLPKSTF